VARVLLLLKAESIPYGNAKREQSRQHPTERVTAEAETHSDAIRGQSREHPTAMLGDGHSATKSQCCEQEVCK